MTNKFMEITKRNGIKVPFDSDKITSAIEKAIVASKEDIEEKSVHPTAQFLTYRTVAALQSKESVSVEEVQDEVERQLMYAHMTKTARAYIAYRDARARIRNSNDELLHAFQEIVTADAEDNNEKRSNANVDGNAPMGAMLQLGAAAGKSLAMNRLMTKEQADFHRNGTWHIHDMDFFGLTFNCCQIDLKELLEHGFSTGHGYVRPPQSIGVASALTAIVIQANQNQMFGGQGITAADFALAPSVATTYHKEFVRALTDAYEDLIGDLGYSAIVGNWVKRTEENTKIHLKLDMPSSFFTVLQEMILAEGEGTISLESIGRIIDVAKQRAYKRTDRAAYQAMESLIHNLNTMHSRAGAQVPFSSLNYGTDTSPEGRMVIRNLLLATDAGLGNGETPIFPIQVFKLKTGINYNPGDPNYDLFKLAIKVSAKRLFPNFLNLDAPFNQNPDWYPGNYKAELSVMGCRTRVFDDIYGDKTSAKRGNIAFLTLNLPRLAIEAGRSEMKFFFQLDILLEKAAQELLDRFEIIAQKKAKNFDFLMGQNVWMGSEKLHPNDEIRKALKHGTLSIGFIGLAETLVALYGHHHGEGEEYQEKGLAIIKHMREFTDEATKRFQLNFSLFATPAEGLSGRFTAIDRKKYGIIPGVTDKEYYTNSMHIPVSFPISAFEKIRLEAPYHALCNAGAITYVETDGDIAQNLEAFEAIIRCMHDNNVSYGSVNHPVDRDPVCGYVGVIGDVCPRCGRREGEAISIQKIEELRKKYPNVPDQSFIGKL